MGIEDTKDVVRRLVDECVNQDRAELLDRYTAADVRVHPGTPGSAPDTEGVAALRAAFRGFHTTFPDLHVELEEVIAEGDLVAARWTATGTHSAELAGIPATGRAVRWGGTDVYRVTDGRVAEWWRNDDSTWLIAQLR
jgi:steroid delta-isomerase-like uncharacterized protein